VPTYQYACTECDEQLEVRQSFTDDPLTVCPACEGRLRKVFNAVGVVFKGSGFYKTDSRKSPDSGAGQDSGADKGGDTSRDKGGDKGSGKGSSGSSSASGDSSSGSSSASSNGSSRSPSTSSAA
jgi:putative FmdB family regulatory protein